MGAVCTGYRDNPYHNFNHAFSVLHASYMILHQTDVASFLNQEDILGLFIGCLGHDIDHPGWNNAYEVNSGGDIAIMYNDNSVLENHHAATTFGILRREGCDILESLPKDRHASVRKTYVRSAV